MGTWRWFSTRELYCLYGMLFAKKPFVYTYCLFYILSSKLYGLLEIYCFILSGIISGIKISPFSFVLTQNVWCIVYMDSRKYGNGSMYYLTFLRYKKLSLTCMKSLTSYSLKSYSLSDLMSAAHSSLA